MSYIIIITKLDKRTPERERERVIRIQFKINRLLQQYVYNNNQCNKNYFDYFRNNAVKRGNENNITELHFAVKRPTKVCST